MKRLLIATLYSDEPVTVSAAKIGVDKVVLLIDENPDKKQQDSLEVVKKALGPIVETVKTDVYDILKVAKKAVEVIDKHERDEIYVNITSGRKTKALGLLFAAYHRSKKIKKIVYITEETKAMIVLPKLDFGLKPTQVKVLEFIDKNGIKSMVTDAKKMGISRSMLYSTIDELKNMGLIEEKPKIILTDAGKIGIL